MVDVLIPASRWLRWNQNFTDRHGQPVLQIQDGALHGQARDGAHFTARLPFDRRFTDAAALTPTVAEQELLAATPLRWGVLLVRKGGFAIARLEGEALIESKVGRRHVQGRTKAGGQSQQRFARRRANQARQAFEAAADHAARILVGGDMAAGDMAAGDMAAGDMARVEVLVAGGDRTATDKVLGDPRLSSIRRVGWFLDVPEPRRAELERALIDARSAKIAVVNAQE